MAGTACAAELAGNGIEVTLIDRHDYSQFQPLLYQVASSQLPAEDIARPLATMFRDRAQVTVVDGEVTAIDVSTKTVTTDAGTFGPADQLVLAAGSQANFFGVPGAAEHAFPLYTVRDAERLRRHLRDRLRELSTSSGDGALTVVVGGGGPTGVEIAGALAELFRALRDEGRLAGRATVRLVDPGKALLAPFTRSLAPLCTRKAHRDGGRRDVRRCGGLRGRRFSDPLRRVDDRDRHRDLGGRHLGRVARRPHRPPGRPRRTHRRRRGSDRPRTS